MTRAFHSEISMTPLDCSRNPKSCLLTEDDLSALPTSECVYCKGNFSSFLFAQISFSNCPTGKKWLSSLSWYLSLSLYLCPPHLIHCIVFNCRKCHIFLGELCTSALETLKSRGSYSTHWQDQLLNYQWTDNYGTVSRGKTAVLLDFVQITSHSPPPLPPIWTTCTTFFRRQNSRFEVRTRNTIQPKHSLRLKLLAFCKK